MSQIIEQDPALSAVANRVVQSGERVRLKVGDREVAVISLEDLEFLENVENDLDLLDGLKALQEIAKDKEVVPWAEILANLKREHPSDSGQKSD